MRRILFLVSSMQGGGAERVAALLCNHWVTVGHHVMLMPTFSGRGECLYPLDSRVRLEYLADRVGTDRQSAWHKLRRLGALRQIIQSERPDVVVSFLPHVNIAALLASFGLGVPVVVSERSYPPMRSVGIGIEQLRRWLYPRASAVVMQTERGREWLMATAPLALGKVIPNPVVHPLPVGNLLVAPDKVVAKDRKILLAVGRLAELKRFDWVIHGFKKLAAYHPDWDLVILGEGSERGKLESLIHEMGLRSRVHLPGRVENLGEWYERAELYVLSSRFEGFPNSLVEAMAHGLPAISVDCDTGPRDIIRNDVDGLLVATDDGGHELMQALDMLLTDPDRRNRFAAEAKGVRKRFSIDKIATEWDLMMERI